MYWDIVEVKLESHLILSVRFSDGTCGKVRFLPAHLKGVFTPLKNPAFFEKVFKNVLNFIIKVFSGILKFIGASRQKPILARFSWHPLPSSPMDAASRYLHGDGASKVGRKQVQDRAR